MGEQKRTKYKINGTATTAIEKSNPNRPAKSRLPYSYQEHEQGEQQRQPRDSHQLPQTERLPQTVVEDSSENEKGAQLLGCVCQQVSQWCHVVSQSIPSLRGRTRSGAASHEEAQKPFKQACTFCRKALQSFLAISCRANNNKMPFTKCRFNAQKLAGKLCRPDFCCRTQQHTTVSSGVTGATSQNES